MNGLFGYGSRNGRASTLHAVLHSGVLCLLIVGVAGCSRSDEGQRVEQGVPQDRVLAGDALDALDLLIMVNARTSAHRWNRELDISSTLQARLAKYAGKTHFKIDLDGVSDALLEDGAKTIIPEGAGLAGTVEGELHAEVDIVAGEVGVVNGEIFVSAGARAIVNGRQYNFIEGKWVLTDEHPRERVRKSAKSRLEEALEAHRAGPYPAELRDSPSIVEVAENITRCALSALETGHITDEEDNQELFKRIAFMQHVQAQVTSADARRYCERLVALGRATQDVVGGR